MSERIRGSYDDALILWSRLMPGTD